MAALLRSSHILLTLIVCCKHLASARDTKEFIFHGFSGANLTLSGAGYFLENKQENVSLKLNSGKPMQVWIDYSEEEKLLNVTLAPIESRKPERPLLSTGIDLSLVLLDSMYVGFSSSTGSVASYHYIIGWSFNKSGQAQSLDASKLPSFPARGESGSRPQLKIIQPVIAAIAILTAISLFVYITTKKYKEIREDWEPQYGPQRFSYRELYKSTKGFKDREILGSGDFGRIYRGVLPSSNLQVAIKRVSHGSNQGIKEFVTEIASMGRLRHRNLVQLLGYCRRKQELFLVYDYMTNGSLDKFLFSSEKPKLDWRQRYQVIKGVTSALHYLHEGWEQIFLHRDVKASNVLLDADFNGRLGDFGLAKFYDHGSIPQTTHVVGTVGYLAPELTSTGRPTTNSDVFSFGIFMLEVGCGRKPVEPRRQPEEVILVYWVLESYRRGAILGTSDLRLEGNYVAEEMELVLKLGLLCAYRTPTSRPTMRQLVQYLDKNATLPQITPHGAGIGLLHSHEISREWTSPVPVSADNFSLCSLSEIETYSILYSGR